MDALGHYEAEFPKMGTDRIRQLRQLADKEIPRPVAHQHRLLHCGLDRHETHRGLGHGGADRLSIGGIGLAPLHEGLDVGGRDQPHLMAELRQFPRPVVGSGAGFRANKARG